MIEEKQFPPYEAFYWQLNNRNLLAGPDNDDVVGRENYQMLQNLWRDKQFKCMLDMLEWYNNLDVTAFVEAVDVQYALFYEHFNVDLFKDGISLPGISLKYCMSTTDAKFALYGKKFSFFYKELRENIVGGPSLVFHRHQEKNKTKFAQKNLAKMPISVSQLWGQTPTVYIFIAGVKIFHVVILSFVTAQFSLLNHDHGLVLAKARLTGLNTSPNKEIKRFCML